MKQQQRMMIMKDLTKNIRSKGTVDARSRRWVSELLAADCEKAWIHTGWEWYGWLEHMKDKDENEGRERKNGGNASAQGGANDLRVRREVRVSGTKSQSLRHGGEEWRSWEMKKRMRGCWIFVKRKGKNGQNTGSVMRRCSTRRKSLGRMRN